MQSIDFGKEVKKKLIDFDMTQTKLCELITEKTGLYVDTPYLARIFAGERKPPKIIEAIREILDLPEA